MEAISIEKAFDDPRGIRALVNGLFHGTFDDGARGRFTRSPDHDRVESEEIGVARR